MKIILHLFLAIGFTLSLSAQEMQKGIWHTGNANTKIETYEKDGAWYGKVIESDNPQVKVGADILRDFKVVDQHLKGIIFLVARNRKVDAIIEPTEDELKITVSARSRSRTMVWKRLDKE